ncbi:MAG TPA: hypothetical protein ENN98_07005 [Desulfurivibrio alkaliphilus]|uniref:Uncharacterized protein n=1 Tax=Desulfurivibrio alkaliphilus TaxID=427923 RepID=A0A7C2TIF6_9BACT|nr:hypothetical protein [Desulfurivibrio alkaliphilus]
MVISDEFKFPRVLPVDPFRKERKVEAVFAIPAIARIGAFKRGWNRNRQEERPPPRRHRLRPEEEQEVRRQVEQANRNFENHGILLRLLLTRTDEGYQLDVYDCTGDTECRVASDLQVTFEELPALLRNLEEEAGLLIDTIT